MKEGRTKKKERRRRRGGTHIPKGGFLALLQVTRICRKRKDRHKRLYVSYCATVIRGSTKV